MSAVKRIANVISILEHLPSDAHVEARQAAVRELIVEGSAIPLAEFPVSFVHIGIGPEGGTRKIALLVEPEQVPAYLAAMNELMADLLDLAHRHRKTLMYAASVVSFTLSDIAFFPAMAN